MAILVFVIDSVYDKIFPNPRQFTSIPTILFLSDAFQLGIFNYDLNTGPK